jgi:hypothetical protein
MAKVTLKKLQKELQEEIPVPTRAEIQEQVELGNDIGDFLDDYGTTGENKEKIISDLNSYGT